MCGIAGFLDPRGSCSPQVARDVVAEMTESLRHRGPDDGGVWVDAPAGIAFGNRRLAVIDLTEDGHQPMQSSSGRYALVYNGEIYNFQSLQRELTARGHRFLGHSDTEVLVAAISEWGVESCAKKLIGMFAFAVWDKVERRLFIVRDRLGIKPLYYGMVGGVFVFGSELRAIVRHPEFRSSIDRVAVASLMRTSCISSPHSIYEGIYKLPPGVLLSVNQDVSSADIVPSHPLPRGYSVYWSAQSVVAKGREERFDGDEQQAIDSLDALLRKSVKSRLVADVPVGVLLSGGVDSSTVAALMQTQSSKPVESFSVGFEDENCDESTYAGEVARHLGTSHNELTVTARDALSVIPSLPNVYDEPFADSSQIPTVLVSRFARQGVTVCLSGDGGDELFAGYQRYLWADRIWRTTGWVNADIRKGVATGLKKISPAAWDNIFNKLRVPNALGFSSGISGDRIYKLLDLAGATNREALYLGLLTNQLATEVVREPDEGWSIETEPIRLDRAASFVDTMSTIDLLNYLPDDILPKVDRASMAVGLEVRVPLLDHRVVEFASRFPPEWKIRAGEQKWPLKQVLGRYVPSHLFRRPKMGFAVPLARWLRGPLRDWAESLLDPVVIRRHGLLHDVPIQRRWQEHLSGERNWHTHLWNVLMLQAWLEVSRAKMAP